MRNQLEGVTAMHSASVFYAAHELDGRIGDLAWAMLDLGGPLDATEWLAAGAMTSCRQFPDPR